MNKIGLLAIAIAGLAVTACAPYDGYYHDRYGYYDGYGPPPGAYYGDRYGDRYYDRGYDGDSGPYYR